MASESERDAALVLRGLKRRVDRLEEDKEEEFISSLLRSVADEETGGDLIFLQVNESAGGKWDTNSWDSDLEWA